ncbi:MAG: M60 family metallopeptidase, partial [Haloferula sp.]
TTTKIATPYGGGIYIEVPLRATAGVVDVTVTGAVRAPYFSAKSFHQTTPTEWDTEKTHPAPWADFQSDKFMTQVPTNWIYAHPDPAQLMTDWDDAMDAINDLMGFPRIRGKETMYPQVDIIMRSAVHAPGYPAINVTDNPNNDRGGYHNNYIVRGPGASPTAAHIEFHEQGHAYFFPKFGGENESTVNLLQPAMLQRKFGYDFDVAQRSSLGSGNVNRTMDNTAVAWMCVFNFSPREVPMASAEKSYQHKGHAKFLDVARLFGWQGLDDYWKSFMEDDEAGTPYGTSTDDLLLRLCIHVGKDIRPLFHFWGIHPQNPSALEAAITAANIPASTEIRDQLLYYRTLVPADNAAFRTFALAWWGRQPSINGFWEEREHARQWDTTPLYGAGDQQRSEATNPGEIYNENSASDIVARVDELVALYYAGTIIPDPMGFAVAPASSAPSTISMTALTATASVGPVEYLFENTTNGNSSGWTTSTTWDNGGLTVGVPYSYRVKARDGDSNETGWSDELSATITPPDTTAPTPDPMSFASAPAATGETTITMTAATATDPSGVEYYFECTAGAGGSDSGWQDGTSYTDTGLTPGTEYTYQVRARDKSAAQTATGWSAAVSATTTASSPETLYRTAAGGAITWDSSSMEWSAVTGGPYDTDIWTSGDSAVFEGTPGTVTLTESIGIQDLHFSTNSGYLIQGGALNFLPGGVISNSYNLANNTIASTITGAPAVNTADAGGQGYVGLEFAPTTGHTQALGVITNPVDGVGPYDKAGVVLGGTTIGNTVQEITYAPTGNSRYGRVWKQGSGTWTTGDLKTGILSVDGGTLIVNGTITTDYAGLYMLSGTLSGDATVFKNDRRAANDFVSGTAVAPGDGIGTITFDWGTNGNPNASQWTTAFRAGSSYEWELGAGVDNNDVAHIVDGRLIVEGITLEIIDAGGTPEVSDQFAVFTYDTLDSKTLDLGSVVFDTTGAPDWDASGASLVDDGAGTIYLTGMAEVGGGSDYASWLAGYSLTDTSDEGDDDKDRLGNLVEAFFGSDPSVWNAGLSEVARAGNTVTFKHPEADPALSDVSGSYEWSMDLSTWNGSGDTEGGVTVTIPEPPAPVAGVTTVTANITSGDPAQLFLRVVATKN